MKKILLLLLVPALLFGALYTFLKWQVYTYA